MTAGGSGVNGWRVSMTLPSGTTITNLWNGVNTGISGIVQVADAGYNGKLAAGQSTSFGFQANGSGTGVTVSCTPT